MFGKLTYALLAAAGLTQLASADQMDFHYKVRWNGIELAESKFQIQTDYETYSVFADSRTTGLASFFSSGEGVMTASGRWNGDQLYSTHYESKGVWDGENYRRMIKFDDQGQSVHEEVDWPEQWLKEEPREAVPDDARKGPDPLSLVMYMMRHSLPMGEERTYRAYDGDLVADFAVTCEAETVAVEPVAFIPEVNKAAKCSFDMEVVEGKRIITDKDKRQAKVRENKRKRRGGGQAARNAAKDKAVNKTDHGIYMADAMGWGWPMPVRIIGGSSYGKFEIELVHASRQVAAETAR